MGSTKNFALIIIGDGSSEKVIYLQASNLKSVTNYLIEHLDLWYDAVQSIVNDLDNDCYDDNLFVSLFAKVSAKLNKEYPVNKSKTISCLQKALKKCDPKEIVSNLNISSEHGQIKFVEKNCHFVEL